MYRNIFYLLFSAESDQRKHVHFFVRVSLVMCGQHFILLAKTNLNLIYFCVAMRYCDNKYFVGPLVINNLTGQHTRSMHMFKVKSSLPVVYRCVLLNSIFLNNVHCEYTRPLFLIRIGERAATNLVTSLLCCYL